MSRKANAALTVRRIKLTLHSWELPSFSLTDLRAATRDALRVILRQAYPEARFEIAWNAGPRETVYNIATGQASVKGAELDLDVTGGSGDDMRHAYRHRVAADIEAAYRVCLQLFIEADAKARYENKSAGMRRRIPIHAAPIGREPISPVLS